MSRVGVLVTLLCAACVQSNEVKCEDGRLCAPGYVCDNDNHRCLSPDQINACEGRDEGADCSFGGAPGACRMGTCEPLVCGDGVRSIGEACDGDDLGSADCTTAGFYNASGLACSEFCTFDVSGCTGSCGDNVINGDELCDGVAPQGTCVDLGFDAGALACAASCGNSFATCGRFGWTPETTGLSTVGGFHGTSANDLWVVGADSANAGVIAHYDGAAWTRTTTGSTDRLIATWAVSPTDAWIVSEPSGRPLRWNGTQWTTVAAAPVATYKDVWAASGAAVFFATTAGVTWFDGASWQPLGALTDSIVELDGASATDVWAAKTDGTLAHWNGTAWLPVAVDVTVRHIDVLSPTSVWVIGPSTTSTAAAIAHWNGSTWTAYTDPSLAPESFSTVAAIADNDVWVIGPLARPRHFDGLVWTDSTTTITTTATVGVLDAHRFGDTVIAAATNGFVHRYRGQMMARLTPPATNPLQSVWSAGPNATFIGDLRGKIYRYNGQTWTTYTVDTNTISFAAMFGTSATDVWTSGTSGRVHRWDGNSWSLQTTLLAVNAIWASGPNDVWFFGNGITHYANATFTPITVAASGFRTGTGSGPNDIWALAPSGTGTTAVAHYTGTWSVTTMPHDMTSIVALAPNDVYVTADDNHIMHFDGNAWSDTTVPVSSKLDYIAASAADDVIAASATEAVHFDGTRWTPIRLPFDSLAMVRALTVAPGYIDFLYGGASSSLRRLIRTRFWSCRATETGCGDGVDDDCDGDVDALDADCP